MHVLLTFLVRQASSVHTNLFIRIIKYRELTYPVPLITEKYCNAINLALKYYLVGIRRLVVKVGAGRLLVYCLGVVLVE